MYWDATIDGKNFSNVEVCYSFPNPVCPGDPFAAKNYNYAGTGFSYYWQLTCTVESGAQALAVAAAAASLLVTTSLV